MIRPLIAFWSAALLASPALAQDPQLDSVAVAAKPPVFTRQAEAKSGEATTLVTLANDPSADCKPPENTPAVRVVRMPAHGALLLQGGPKAAQYAAGNPLAACNGKSQPALYVVYRPDSAYHGTDRIEIAFEQTGGVTKMAYDIIVK